MSDDLPMGWVKERIGEICEIYQPKTISKKELIKNGRHLVYGANGVIGRYDKYNHEHSELLITCRGATCGTVNISSPKSWITGNAMVIRPKFNFIKREFLEYFFKGSIDLNSVITGSAQPQITRQSLSPVLVTFPPLNEQRRIVDKLDRIGDRHRTARNELNHIPKLIARYKQAVLAAACSGKLTEDWREKSNRQLVSLEDVVLSVTYGTSAKSSQEGIIPVLRMGNIQNGNLDWSNLVFTSDQEEIEKYKLVNGDVLFNRTNSTELVGKTAVYKGERPAIYAGYLIRIRCNDHLLPEYLNYCLNSPAGKDYCYQVKSDGVSQSNINAKKLVAFTFELPYVEEQKEIVRRVEKMFEKIDRMEQEYQKAAKLCDRLEQATLAKAFRGELVPQDPDDEPASVLLEQVKREKEKGKKGVKSNISD